MKPNRVKALLRQGKPVFGTWITLCPHPRLVKMLASVGLDFVILEMEHTDFSLREVGVLAMLARECGLVPVVRPPGTGNPHALTRPLDAGAQGLLLPAIESVGQLQDIIKVTKYAPLGNRPMNLRGPHTDYEPGEPREILEHLNAHTLTVVMVESPAAIDNLDAIVQVAGVDAVMIGPDDLSQEMGLPGDVHHPSMMAMYERVFEICRARNVPYGLSCHSLELAEQWYAKGCTWLPYSNDAAQVLNAYRSVVPRLMKVGGRT